MSVVMKGGTSGDAGNYLPDVSVAYNRQVPQDTSSTSCPTDPQYCQNTGNREGPVNPPVPCNGTPDDTAV
jgi:hypothetical protein